jgi:hypothetical protein
MWQNARQVFSVPQSALTNDGHPVILKDIIASIPRTINMCNYGIDAIIIPSAVSTELR